MQSCGLDSMEGTTFSTESTAVEVLPLSPDQAHARTAFQTTLSQDGAVVYEFGGVITWLLTEVEAGEWRVPSEHTSTPKVR